MLNENYCDSGEAYKAIFYYKPLGCAPMPTVTEPPDEIMTSPSDLFTINTDRQVSDSYNIETSSSFRHFNTSFFSILFALFFYNRGF